MPLIQIPEIGPLTEFLLILTLSAINGCSSLLMVVVFLICSLIVHSGSTTLSRHVGRRIGDSCALGSDGVIITLKPSLSKSRAAGGGGRAKSFAAALQAKWRGRRLESTNSILHVYNNHAIDGLAARLDNASLIQIRANTDVESILPNCVCQTGIESKAEEDFCP